MFQACQRSSLLKEDQEWQMQALPPSYVAWSLLQTWQEAEQAKEQDSSEESISTEGREVGDHSLSCNASE
jgi:hypothetical protein